MKRMAVIFNSDYQSWPMGGMITYVTQAVGMLAGSYEIELWGCSVDGGAPHPIEINGISYPIHTNTRARTHRKLVPNVARCFWGNLTGSSRFRAERYDILYFHLSASTLGWFAGEFLRRPLGGKGKRPLILFHQHGMAYRNNVGDRLNYLAMDLADLVFFTTDRQGMEYHRQKIHNTNLVWMPSMVDTDYFHPASAPDRSALRRALGIGDDKHVFIFTGRITGWKNPLLLLDAFEMYQKRSAGQGYLVYVGDGDCAEALREQIAAKGLTDSVRLTGTLARAGIRDYLRAANCFVLPSRGEGVSVSTLEAMAAGLPVAAFDVEGMAGLVEPDSGILIKEQTAEAFAAGMERLIGERSCFAPVRTAMKYSIPQVRQRMVDAIDSAIGRKERNP